MLGIPGWRPGEPPPALALVGLQPADSLPEPGILSRHAALAKNIGHEACAVAITLLELLLLVILALVPVTALQETRHSPAAIRPLKSRERFLH